MIALTLKEIAIACDGRLGSADPDATVHRVVIDSRLVRAGDLFVALRGDTHDGHDFVAGALAEGAVAAVIASGAGVAGPVVEVSDPARALLALAAEVRGRLTAHVIAVTGSSGKTSTKDLIGAACATRLKTVASEASYNNEIGVPLTILAADETTEALIVEVGSRGIGHIAALMPVVRPDTAVITNVGPAHLGMFGSLEATATAKAELIEGLGADGTAILNADDALVRAMGKRTVARVILFGRAADAAVRGEDVRLDPDACASFTVETAVEHATVSLRIPGEHSVANALAAIAAARAAGVPLAAAAEGVSSCEAPEWRMQVLTSAGGRTILNDAYNANPDSMLAALKTLVAMAGGRATWAVLGHMAELGDASAEAHDRIGRMAVRLGVGHLVTIGREAKAIHEAARLEGMFGGEATWVEEAGDVLETILPHLEEQAVILVKASRAAGLEALAASLEERA